MEIAQVTLTAIQKHFCAEYMSNGYNVKQAALAVGYAATTGANLMKTESVQKEITRRKDRIFRRYDITENRIIQEVANIAFLDILDIFKDDGTMKNLEDIPEHARRTIAGIDNEQITERDGNTTHVVGVLKKLKLSDKRSALEMLAKYKGLLIEKRHVTVEGEVTHKVEASDLKERIERLQQAVDKLPKAISNALQ